MVHSILCYNLGQTAIDSVLYLITIKPCPMLITKETPSLPKKLPPPQLKWLTGNYAHTQEFRFHIPYSMLMLCKLWDTTPDDLLADFINNLSHGSWKRKEGELAKPHLQQYILEMGYGQMHYNMEDITTMFKELDTIGSLWPANAKIKMIDLHSQWRDKYYNYWFKKWYRKNNRKP
jgi:hypothetical protein